MKLFEKENWYGLYLLINGHRLPNRRMSVMYCLFVNCDFLSMKVSGRTQIPSGHTGHADEMLKQILTNNDKYVYLMIFGCGDFFNVAVALGFGFKIERSMLGSSASTQPMGGLCSGVMLACIL